MSENVFDQKLKDLDAAMASQDIQGVNKATIGILTAAHQFLDTAKKELENTDDPGYKEELTEKIGHVENCKKKIKDLLMINFFSLGSFRFKLVKIGRNMESYQFLPWNRR